MKSKLITIFVVLFGVFLFASDSSAVQFYIDSECNTPGNGTTTTCNGDADDSYDNLDDFTEVVRTAGDIASVRRVASGSYNGSDVNFTSDGTLDKPIILEADYDNYWGDFASSSQTYTVVRGSKAMTASDTITGVAAGDWIFVDVGDQTTEKAKEFAYEVKTVSGTLLTLYLPYKGNSPGAGRTLNVMPDAPVWGTLTTTVGEVSFNTDNYWEVRGLKFQSTSSSGIINMFTAYGLVFTDIILQSNGTTSIGIYEDGINTIYFSKLRLLTMDTGILDVSSVGLGSGYQNIKDSLIDCNNEATSIGIDFTTFTFEISNLIIQNCSDGVDFGTGNEIRARNINFINISDDNFDDTDIYSQLFIEDYNNTIGDNRRFLDTTLTNNASDYFLVQSNTATVRTVGGKSIQVNPTASVSNDNFWGTVKLFEYPIYMNTSQTTFNVYFRPDVIASWSADPTASELWVEIDVLASAAGAFRYTKKSTGVIDMNGSTAWQAIPLVVTASQSGISYLKGWYGKPKEAVGTTNSDANVFFMDNKVDITQP